MRLNAILTVTLFFVLGALLTHCASTKKSETEIAVKIAPNANLTRAEAQARAQLVSNPHYNLSFDFDAKNDFYTATADIRFKLNTAETTFLDFKYGQVLTLAINGKTVSPKQENFRIYLAKEDLKAGENQVVATFKQTFSKNGRGIYRFQDPEDGKIYIWTKLEPFDANQVFPCFDQPDLKSTFTADIKAPTDWKVIFTTSESKKVLQGDKTQWTFPTSPLMSTYLFSIHAGHYEVWTDRYKNIPLRLFVRASLKKYFEAPLWFSITKKGFRFFEKEFAYPYPFKKYDQLVVPDFSSGGMENIAAVNYNERLIPRGLASREEKEALTNILLHEMAHMWFGDLVTMNWWDELWLNESFATFMAYNASEKATEFKEAWSNFQRQGKLSAYIEDQYPTTHPISTEVIDINATLNQFDAITYSKGASALRQLSYYIGEDNFRKGIQAYFKQYAYTNTTLTQFIGSLEKASNMNLRAWSVAWLRNSGVDTIKIAPECSSSKLTRVKFELIPPTPNERPRPHRIPITLYRKEGGKLKTWTIDDWTAENSTEVREISQAMPCPDFIFPNATDQTYIKMALDAQQIRWAQDNLHEITSVQARGIFWNQAYLNLRDGQIKIDDFIKLFSAQIKQEKNQIIVQQFFKYWAAIARYLPQNTEVELGARTKVLEALERYIWSQIAKSFDPLWKKTLLVNWSRLIETEESQKILVDLLKEKVTLKPLSLDQDMRWTMVQRLSALGNQQSDELIAEAKAKDTTEAGFKSFLAAQASKPSLAEKAKWLEEMNKPDANWSLARKQSILYSMFPSTPKQTQLRKDFREQFYKTMRILDKKNEDVSYNRSYAVLAPSVCDKDTIKEFEDYISKQDWNVVTKKSLVIQNQENKICSRIQVR